MKNEQALELASLYNRLTIQYYILHKMQKIKEEIDKNKSISSR